MDHELVKTKSKKYLIFYFQIPITLWEKPKMKTSKGDR